MKLNNVNYYQSFKANRNEPQSKSFMGRMSDKLSGAIDDFSGFIDSTSYTAENISDIAKSAKNVLSSPEEATIGVLTSQIDTRVIENEKAPGWLRKSAACGSAALAAVGTFIAVRKTPGVIKNFIVNNLNKFNLGKKALRGMVTTKHAIGRFVNVIGGERINNMLSSAGSYINSKSPEFLKSFCNKVKLNKLTEWSTGDYVKNSVATLLGYQTGKSMLAKHQNKLNLKSAEQIKADKQIDTKLETAKTDNVDEYSDAA